MPHSIVPLFLLNIPPALQKFPLTSKVLAPTILSLAKHDRSYKQKEKRKLNKFSQEQRINIQFYVGSVLFYYKKK